MGRSQVCLLHEVELKLDIFYLQMIVCFFAGPILLNGGNVQGILDKYEKAFGQKLNREKTFIFFSKNMRMEVREYIALTSGVIITTNFEKYLGLPTIVGQSRSRAFGEMKGRIWERMQGWQENFLSQAGKEVLLKAVIQAIPTYTMSVF
jgi:hypothetical protein